MIALIDAARQVIHANGPREILTQTSLVIEDGERVGILAARGTGKSVLARLFCGIDQPDSGAILRTGSISWPMGAAGMLHPDLTVAENIAIVARMTGEWAPDLIARCSLLGDLYPILHQPMKLTSPAQRAAVAWCLAAAVTHDTYLVDDNIGFGLGRQRDLSEAYLTCRLEQAGLVFLSSNPQQIVRFCDRFLLFIAGRLIPCNDPLAGQAALLKVQAQPEAMETQS